MIMPMMMMMKLRVVSPITLVPAWAASRLSKPLKIEMPPPSKKMSRATTSVQK